MDIHVDDLNQLTKLKRNFTDAAVFKYETTIDKVLERERTINNMFYLTSGRLTYIQNGKLLHVGERDIIWLPYGSSYHMALAQDDITEIEGICLDFQMIDNDGNRIIPSPEVRIMAHDSDGLYLNMYTSAISKQLNAHSDFAFRSIIYNIFAHLFNDVNRYSDTDGIFNEINYAIGIIERTPQSNDSIADLAAQCGISETSLRNKFKLYTGGLNPIEYRNRIRVDKAKELLAVGHCSVEVIAETLGFYDASYFIKIFKRITGQTPNEFRRGRI